jgi:uncharacterized membrane protein
MRLKNKLLTKKILPVSYSLFLLVIFSLLMAFSLWIQVYPQELKSLIFHRVISDKVVFLSFIKYLIISFTALTLVNTIPLIFKYSQHKKNFSLINSFLGQIKAMLPILLLLFYPLRAFVFIGGEPAWIADQTTFYFIVIFILIVSWAMYRLAKEIDLAGVKIALIFFFIFFALFFSYFSVLRLQDLTIEKPDSHAFITVLWNTAQGNFLRYTYLDGPRNWFGLHFEPLIFLFVPLYLIRIPEIFMPALLQLIQVIIGVSGVFPVFFLARKKLKSDFLGLVFGLVYLLFPAFQFQILYDFHIEIVSLVSILWSIYFLELKRYKLFLIFLVLAIFSREEFALFASIFGLYLLFKRGYNKKLGILLLISGFSYLWLVKSLIIPYFGQGDLVPAQVSMFSHLGENLPQMAKTLLSKPGYILTFMFTQRKIQYLVLMFLPLAPLALLSPVVLFSLPFFAINLLLGFDLPSSILWHYQSWLIPILIWAALDFVSSQKGKAKRAACTLLLTSSFLSSLYFGPLNLLNFDLGNTQKGLVELKKSPEIDEIEEVKKIIPQDRSLAVDPNVAPYFADRRDFYLFPGEDDTDYIIIPLKAFRDYPGVDPILKKDGYCLRMVSDFLVYQKQEKCDYPWDDGIEDSSRHILLKNSNTKIVLSQSVVSDKFPLSPNKSNLPGILDIQVFIDSDNVQDYLGKMVYLLEILITSVSPSVVKIYARDDRGLYQNISSCSTISNRSCTSLDDVSSFISQDRKLHLRFYLFADSLVAKEPGDVRIEWLLLRRFKLVSDLE